MWSSILGLGKAKPKEVAPPKPRVALPELLPEEMSGNLSVLERDLNASMKCPAGRNQVFIKSLVTAQGRTPPRIALKCSYRRDVKLPPEIYLQEIRTLCCSNPDGCEAYRAFRQRAG